MTLEQKAGQLFMVAAYSNKDEAHNIEIENYIRKNGIGGLIFMQGDPISQAKLTNRYQQATQIPLMIAMDAEWGPSMRLSNTITFPRQMTLGALQSDTLVYAMGAEIARQLRRLGVQISFSPVVDVNNNAHNPVINDRSFGENVNQVSMKGIAYMKGLQDNKVLACAKHFPGHGDTDTDSHLDLPVIKHNKLRLDSIELKPFSVLAEQGVGSMMVAHLNVPALDTSKNLPSSLSKNIITDILRIKLGYDGLVFTDALNMKGISKYYPSGKAEVKAILAGDDILLFPDNVPQAIQGIVKAVQDSIITEEMLNYRVRRILQAKVWMGLDKPQSVGIANLLEDLNTEEGQLIKERILSNAITLVQNPENLLPISHLAQQQLAVVTVGATSATPFTSMLGNYAKFSAFFIPKTAAETEFNLLLSKLKSYSTVIINYQDMSRYSSKGFGLTDISLTFFNKLQHQNKTILVISGIPYALSKFKPTGAVIVANTADDEAQKAAAQVIMGGRAPLGKLPVTIGAYKEGTGLSYSPTRLAYASPAEKGMSSYYQSKIESIVKDAIDRKIFPGCQILAAKDGVIFYEKSFGNLTYDSGSTPINKNTIYDIASITKIAASVPMLMHMVDQQYLTVDNTLGTYFHMDDSINKKNLSVKEVLAHQSGLAAWIPFYQYLKDSTGKYDSTLLSKVRTPEYTYRINDKLFLRNDRVDTIMYDILNSSLKEKVYRYSDMGYYIFQKIIEETYLTSLDVLTDSLLWKPLGCTSTLYNPRKKGWNYKEIPPTEIDDYFRYATVQGDVHDPGAAMLGGVGGHAGLFSNANDLAKYMQMLLNGGNYGGEEFFKTSTINLFTAQAYSGNRRGLGFDKPAITGDNPVCASADRSSFGHTGFTGTMAWADPKSGLIFIFLSNRSFPNATNNKLAKENIRPKLQQIFYDAIMYK
jgi:beta-glucosidase-like glycosyl hydrolase/CubicO group peptidase (beta-lactamase class C family)